MSGPCIAHGYMVALKVKADHEIVSDYLSNSESSLQINYEGTILYSDNGDALDLLFGLWFQEPMMEFISELQQLPKELAVEITTIRPYVCNWNDNADSHMATITLEGLLAGEYRE